MTSSDENDASGEGLKWVTGGLAVAAGALTLAGLTGEAIGRLIRIHPTAFGIGVACLILSTIAGVFGLLVGTTRQERILAGMFGVALFLAGTLVLVGFHAESTGRQERPTATLALAKGDGGGFSAKVSLHAAGLRPSEYVFILVQGQNSRRHLDPNSAILSGSTEAIPPGEYSKQRLYKGRIGPSPDGTISETFDIAFAQQLYDQVVVQALIAQPGDEERELQLEFGVKTGDRNTFACESVSLDISCATVLVPEPPGPT